MTKLAEMHDRELSARMAEIGFARQTSGLYVAPVDGVIWKGLSVLAKMRHGFLSIHATADIYCPGAYKVWKAVAGEIGIQAPKQSERMGSPFRFAQVNQLVRQARHVPPSLRPVFGYDAGDVGLKEAVNLLYEDFVSVQAAFFGRTKSAKDLLDIILEEPQFAPETINAMVLAFHLEPDLTLSELQDLQAMFRSPVTDQVYKILARMLAARAETYERRQQG